METAKVAIIGFGTIGAGVARLLLEHGERIAQRAGKRLELVHVVDPDLKRSRNFALPPGAADCRSGQSDRQSRRSSPRSSWSAGWSRPGRSC